jgi:hypothetical protein
MLCLLIISYVFSLIKLYEREEQVLPGREGGGESGRAGGKDSPINVFTYE